MQTALLGDWHQCNWVGKKERCGSHAAHDWSTPRKQDADFEVSVAEIETGTGKSMNRESGTAPKSETGERIEKGRVERMTGAVDCDLVTGDSVSFCSEVSGVEMLYFVRWSVTLTAAGSYCSIRRTKNQTKSPS
jgi:hypothetical protein